MLASKLPSSAACQYHIGKCGLPFTGARLEGYAGIALVVLLIGISIVLLTMRNRNRNADEN